MKKKSAAQVKQRQHLEREALLDKMAKHICDELHDGALPQYPEPDEVRSMVSDLMEMMEKSHA